MWTCQNLLFKLLTCNYFCCCYCCYDTRFTDELNLALVFSTKAHADVVNIDASDALSMQGVVDFICYKDVPGSNTYAVIVRDEEIFATNTVYYTFQNNRRIRGS